MKKSKIWLIIITVIIGITNALMLIATLGGMDTDKQLYGSTIEVVKPKPNIKTIGNGEYQTQFDDWYLENFPYRYYFVKVYNQIMYEFGETNNRIISGKEDYLFGEDYVNAYTKEEEAADRDERYKKYAEEIKYIKDCIEGKGKQFIYIISPSKACVYEEFLPERYLDLCRNDRLSNLEYEKNAFQMYGVDYIDSNVFMIQLKNQGIQPYYKQGIHWNCASSSMFLKEIDDRFDIIPGEMEVELSQTKSSEIGYSYGEDDLYRLLNIYSQPVEEDYWIPKILYNDSDLNQKNIFLIGTSFSDLIVEILNGAFSDNEPKYDELTRYSYLNKGYYYHGGKCETLELTLDLSNTNILEIIDKSDVIIFENNSTYIPESYFIISNYLSEHLN